MRTLDYTDRLGFVLRVQLPDDASDEDAELGIPLGPPSLEPLDLPIELERRLHAELVRRGLFTYNDVLRHKGELIAAWQTALTVDAMRLMSLYAGDGTIT